MFWLSMHKCTFMRTLVCYNRTLEYAARENSCDFNLFFIKRDCLAILWLPGTVFLFCFRRNPYMVNNYTYTYGAKPLPEPVITWALIN